MTTSQTPIPMHARLRVDYQWTPRQRQVLDLMAGGKSNTEIAEALNVSLAGAKWHVSEILSKLQAESREEAAEYWRRYNGVAPRFARIFRGISPGLALKGGGLALAAAAVGGVLVLVVIARRGDDDRLDAGAGAAAETATAAAATPLPAQAVDGKLAALWRWDSDTPDPWVWVRAHAATVFASVNPRGSDGNLRGPGYVVALDTASGTELWRFDTPSLPFPIEISDENVVFGTSDGTVYALAASTGKKAWERPFDGLPFQVLRAGTALVVADADPELWGFGKGLPEKQRLAGRVEGLDPASGSSLWKTAVGKLSALAVVAGRDLVVASSEPSGDSQVVLLDGPTGRVRWRASTPTVAAPPVIAGKVLLVPGQTLTAYDLDSGKVTWAETSSNGGTFSTPLVVGDAVFAATNTGSLESRSLSTGRLNGASGFSDCGFLPIQHSQLFLSATSLRNCGIWRLNSEPNGKFNPQPVITPQGKVQSADAAGGVVFFSTRINPFAPTVIVAVRP